MHAGAGDLLVFLAADSSSSSPKVVVCLLSVGSQVEKSLLAAT